MGDADPKIARLERIRDWRGPAPDAPTIAGIVGQFAREHARLARLLGGLCELWEELVPRELVRASALVGVRGGVLTIEADSSSAAFAIDRLLRGGVEAAMRERAVARGLRLTKVRVRTASNAQGPAGRSQGAD